MKKTIMIGIILIVSIAIFLSYSIVLDILSDKESYYPGNYLNNSNFTADFETIKKGFQSGDLKIYANIANIPKEYYVRPELYNFYDKYKNITAQNGVYGYGAQPGEVSYSVKKFEKGQHIDVYTFVFSSYDVRNYQGIGLILESPNGKLFDSYTDPSDILLYPIPLKYSDNVTDEDWTYRIKMGITAKENIPKGKYIFKLRAGQPSSERQKEFLDITRNMSINTTKKYMTGGMIQPSKFFDFILYVHD